MKTGAVSVFITECGINIGKFHLKHVAIETQRIVTWLLKSSDVQKTQRSPGKERLT